jgi:DNA helicase II / ATP-dependent DNA helicase PcrA
MKLNESKNFIYCTKKANLEHIKKYKNRMANCFTLSSIINLMKLNLTEPEEEKIKEIAETYNYLIDKKDIDNIIYVYNYIGGVEKTLNPKSEGMMDFTDMLYLAYTKVSEKDFPKYDVVMTDESQDFSPLQYNLILRFLKPNGRLVSVGDSKQLIYGFIGSNLNSFNAMKERDNTTLLPLSVTYRCAKNIVKLANEILPGTEAKEDAIDGIVRNGSLLETRDGDYIICRNNAPLVDAFISLLKQGKSASIMGKEFGNNLLSLIDRIENIDGLSLLLEEKELELSEKGVSNPKKHATYQSLIEKCNIIKSLYNYFGSLDKVESQMGDVFSNNSKKGINLSTIHKSKGLQAERVFILNWHLLPSEYAVSELELMQEKCLQYVAVTRAKNELVFCEI